MSENTSELVGAVGTLEQSMSAGFDEVNLGLAQVESAIYDVGGNLESAIHDMGRQIAGTFTWGFNSILASMGGMKTALDELVKISRTPAQTAAYEQFEIARDAFNQGLYDESLEALRHAINGVPGVTIGYKLEWRFYELRGLIFLGSYENAEPELLDPAQAEQSFLLAARYARKYFPTDAAKALLAAGWAAYVQNTDEKLHAALAYSEDAASLDPNLGEALFQVAKCQMALGDPEAAFPALEKAAKIGGLFLAKAAADGDFKRHEKELVRFFRRLRSEMSEQVSDVAKPIAEKIEPLTRENEVFAARSDVRRTVAMARNAGSVSLVELADCLTKWLLPDEPALKKLRFSVVRTSAEEWYEEIVEQLPTGELMEKDVQILDTPARLFGLIGAKYRVERRQVPVMRSVTRKVPRRGAEKKERLVVDGLGNVIRVLRA